MSSHPKTFVNISETTFYVKCDVNVSASTHNNSATPFPPKGTIDSKALSWEIIFFPMDNYYMLRNALGVYLGWDSNDDIVADAGLVEDNNQWVFEKENTTQRYKIRALNTDKYITRTGNDLELSTNGSIWDFQISTVIPPLMIIPLY